MMQAEADRRKIRQTGRRAEIRIPPLPGGGRGGLLSLIAVHGRTHPSPSQEGNLCLRTCYAHLFDHGVNLAAVAFRVIEALENHGDRTFRRNAEIRIFSERREPRANVAVHIHCADNCLIEQAGL
ncbi:hypothetical protein U14_04163 [Candidatus Moduliflexus flocculans]|uniref:Uncharacterized protein n=1 Tax=Candidatus Moduliflexus flocculans TaxID=1499966 RepID=A0A0S6W403_9BACT|nr:hypothetical protein U14_04163 [Candidatus Moduliflexus flocculans]